MPERAEVERLLLRCMNPAAIHWVLALESRAENLLDFRMNAAIQTDRASTKGRFERWPWSRKLRSVRVEHFAHPLHARGGGFTCILQGPPCSHPT